MEPFKSLWDFRDVGEVLLVDKPLDWTSFDVVKKIKVLFDVRKVGHAGTLDPKATGLLIVCTGKQTRTIATYLNEEKEYTGSFQLGVRTPSYDSETEVVETKDSTHITPERLEQALKKFMGKVVQTVPMYSAAKFEGKPLYLYARKGETVDRPVREIEISDFRVIECRFPMVDFAVVCSKGTYVRALIEDLGNELQCGAALRSLRRVRIGSHTVDNALTIENLMELRQFLERRQHTNHEISEPA